MAVRRDGNQSGSRKRPSRGGHPSRGGTTVGGGTKGRKPTRYKSPTRTGSPLEQAADVALDVAEKHPKPKVRKAVKKGRRQGIRLQRRANRVQRQLRGSKASRSAPTFSQRQKLLEVPKKDTDTKINLGPLGKLNIEAELEGRGGIAKYAKTAKKIATSDIGQHALKSAGVNLPGGETGKRFTADLVDLPAQAIPSAYAVGAGLKEAAQGRPRRIKEVAEGIKEHDPIALTLQGRVKEAGKEVEKHPGLAAVSAYGAGAAVSRGAGAVARSGAIGKKAKRAGSTKRAPKRAPGTRLVERQSYSKGLGAKAAQVGMDLYKQRRAKKIRRKAQETKDPQRRDFLNRQAAQADPVVMSNRAVTRRTDEHEELAEIRRRQQIGRAGKAGRETLPKDPKRTLRRRLSKKARRLDREVSKDHRAAVALLISQNIVKPTRRSLEAYKRQLDRVAKHEELTPAETRANYRLRQQLDQALKDKSLDFAVLTGEARAYKGEVAPRQAELVRREIVPAERARMAPQVNYAVQEMGAKWRPMQRKGGDKRPEGDGWERKGEMWIRPAILTMPVKAKGAEGWIAAAEGFERRAKEWRARGNEKAARLWEKKAAQQRDAAHDHEAGVAGSRRLTIEEIEAHMKAQDPPVDPGAYVSQAPGQRGARNFYSSWAEPKGISGKARTGEAVRKGTFEADREVGAENLARQEGLIQATKSYGQWIGENRYRKSGEKTDFNTADEAAAYRDNNLNDSPYDWRVVATRPQFGRKDQSRALLDEADQFDAGSELDVTKGIQQALEGNGGGKYVLVPDVAARQKGDHAALLGNRPLKITRKVGRNFSGTVLTTSGFTWPIGNVGEGILRLAVNRAGPSSFVLAKKSIAELRKIDPDLADDFEAGIGQGHLGSYEMQKIHTVAKEFQGTRWEGMAKALGALFRAPGPKQMGQAWGNYTRWVFGGNGWLEHQLRLAAAGKHLKNEGFAPRWFRDGPKAMGKAADQAARGMKGTPEQVQAARFVDRAMGKYSKWSPEMRFTVAVFTPFVAWSLNAVKFFTDVLPRDHPVLTGLLASTERATEEWRKSHGLGKYVDGAAPGWMQPSIVVDGKLVPVGRYTPAGLFADPLETAGSQVLPQFSGILMATKGLDWKGDPLFEHERPDDVTEAERLKAMATSGLGAFVPFFGLHKRIEEKGATTALNPFRGYEHNTKVSGAYDRLKEIEAAKQAIKAKHPDVSSDNPTPEYAKLHKEFRKLNELIFRESKGKYGNKYKEPHEPSGSNGSTSSSGSGWDQYREGGAPRQKSGWDAYR